MQQSQYMMEQTNVLRTLSLSPFFLNFFVLNYASHVETKQTNVLQMLNVIGWEDKHKKTKYTALLGFHCLTVRT